MNVTVNYYDESLKNEILRLPNETLAKFLMMVDVLIECGANVNIPQVVVLGERLFRSKLSNTDAYLYYCQSGKKQITVLYVSEKCDRLADQFLTWLKGRQLEVTENVEDPT